ncbi:hypothetical protein ACH4GK_33420 [Streptomyces rimosus]|uniref:hypothetical protein n=1 Tax=Streptomyces rimosus TaxID=1927 RepID=UPI0004C5B193|nr:hypothetical protein [Streptomyces rimosus]
MTTSPLRHPTATIAPPTWPATSPIADRVQELRIRITGAADCHTVHVAWPTDPPGPRLVPRPNAAIHTPGWKLASATPGGLELHRAPATSVGPGGEDIEVTGLDSAGVPGPLTLTVTATDGDTAHVSRHRLHLTGTSHPQIEDFHATPLTVPEYGGKATLSWTWTGPHDQGTWYLARSGHAETVLTDKDYTRHDDVYSTTVTDLTETTAFGLLWEGKIDGHEQHPRAVAYVFVSTGDINAGNLSADGTVTVLGETQTLTIRDQSPHTYTAKTDGFLLLNLKDFRATAPALTTQLTIEPTHGALLTRTVTSTKTATGYPEAHTQMPVPASATITVSGTTQDTLTTLCWVPLGSGPLPVTRPTEGGAA